MIKYAIRFYRGNPALKKADEIIIKFRDNNNGTGLLNFIDKSITEKQRLIVDISELDTEIIKKSFFAFVAANKKISNFALKLDYSQTNIALSAYSEGIKFFFNNHVNSWDKLIEARNCNVSDVYITDELGFDIKEVSDFCKKNNILIRVYPNVAQTSSGKDQDITSFFIRPEDDMFYNKYVDVYEFWGPLDRQDVLYNIYKDNKWDGDLGTLILNLPIHLNSDAVIPYFGEARLNCKKRCDAGKCEVCDRVYSFGRTITDKRKHFIYEHNNVTDINENI